MRRMRAIGQAHDGTSNGASSPGLWSPQGRVFAAALRARLGLGDLERPVDASDWPAISALAARHRVEGLLDPGFLRRLGAPAEVVERAGRRQRRLTLSALGQLALQCELQDAFVRAGIDSVVLKGAPLAVEAFGSPTVRGDRDIDLLVAPDDVARAAAVLEGRGMRWEGWGLPDASETTLADGVPLALLMEAAFVRDGQLVELHWRLAQNRRLLPVEPAWLTAPRTVAVHGQTIRVLPEVPAFLHLAVHGTLHRWRRLKWLADLPALIGRRPRLTAPDVLAEAEARGLERCLATGLLLAERVFGPFLAPSARDWARRVEGTGILLRQSTAALDRDDSDVWNVAPRDLLTFVGGRLAVSRDRSFSREEVRSLVLEGANAHTDPSPGLRTVAAAPLRWLARGWAAR